MILELEHTSSYHGVPDGVIIEAETSNVSKNYFIRSKDLSYRETNE